MSKGKDNIISLREDKQSQREQGLQQSEHEGAA